MYFKDIFENILFHANCPLTLFNYELYITGINDMQGVQFEKNEYLQNKIKLYTPFWILSKWLEPFPG